MNSITKYLTPETLAAKLITMRSGKKEFFLIVEGSEDISLFSQVFGLPQSNFVDCHGKGNLMDLYRLIPRNGLDAGTVFIRDRDHDTISDLELHGISLFVSDFYDVEMHLLHGRILARIIAEYLKDKATESLINNVERKVLRAASHVGALRLFAVTKNLDLKFEDLEFKFVDHVSLEVDVPELVRLVSARSRIDLRGMDVANELNAILTTKSDIEICSGKDVLEVLHIALARTYNCTNAKACTIEVLARTMRIAASLGDLRSMSLLQKLAEKIKKSTFLWPGIQLEVA